MFTVIQCGSGLAGAGEYWLCQKVALLPSIARAARPSSDAVSCESAVTVQPVRASVGSSRPSTLISAALLHGPRLPASEVAVSRTYRAICDGKVTVCAICRSEKAPVTACGAQIVPLRLVSI